MPEKTLADFPDLMRDFRVFRDAPFNPSARATEVFAPCCGRRTAADAILDVRAVPGTIVRGGGYLPAVDQDWLCDGCRARLILGASGSNVWTASRLFSACGAAPEVIEGFRVRERIDAIAREDERSGRPHNPTLAYHRALVEVRTVG